MRGKWYHMGMCKSEDSAQPDKTRRKILHFGSKIFFGWFTVASFSQHVSELVDACCHQDLYVLLIIFPDRVTKKYCMGYLLILSHHGLESGFLMKETLKFEGFILHACFPGTSLSKNLPLELWVIPQLVFFFKCLLLISTCKNYESYKIFAVFWFHKKRKMDEVKKGVIQEQRISRWTGWQLQGKAAGRESIAPVPGMALHQL